MGNISLEGKRGRIRIAGADESLSHDSQKKEDRRGATRGGGPCGGRSLPVAFRETRARSRKKEKKGEEDACQKGKRNYLESKKEGTGGREGNSQGRKKSGLSPGKGTSSKKEPGALGDRGKEGGGSFLRKPGPKENRPRNRRRKSNGSSK